MITLLRTRALILQAVNLADASPFWLRRTFVQTATLMPYTPPMPELVSSHEVVEHALFYR